MIAFANSVDGADPLYVMSVFSSTTNEACADGRYTTTVWYPGSEPLCPIHPWL